MEEKWHLNIDNRHVFQSTGKLPIFWLMGLNYTDIVMSYNQITELYSTEETDINEKKQLEDISVTTTMIIKEYLSNLEIRASYITTNYPEFISLYDEFKQKIEKKQENNHIIEIVSQQHDFSIEQIEQEYQLVNDFFDAMAKQVKTPLIKGENVIQETIGQLVIDRSVSEEPHEVTPFNGLTLVRERTGFNDSSTLDDFKKPFSLMIVLFILVNVIALLLFVVVVTMIGIVFHYLDEMFVGFLISLPFVIGILTIMYGLFKRIRGTIEWYKMRDIK